MQDENKVEVMNYKIKVDDSELDAALEKAERLMDANNWKTAENYKDTLLSGFIAIGATVIVLVVLMILGQSINVTLLLVLLLLFYVIARD